MASLYYHFVDSRVDSKTGDEERLSANVYEQKSMIEAVCMSSKRPTVAIKMLFIIIVKASSKSARYKRSYIRKVG